MANIYLRSTDGSDADNGSTWALAKATLAGALAIATAADTIWVSNNHAETQAAAVTLTYPSTPGLKILCGNDAAEPPTALATTATVTTTGNNPINHANGFAYVRGITFASGSGNSAAADHAIGTASTPMGLIFDACVFKAPSTNAGAPILVGPPANANNDDVLVAFVDCTFSFGATGHSLQLRYGRFEFVNMALDAGGAIPTTLFTTTSATGLDALVEASDLSANAWTNLIDLGTATWGLLTVRDCKLPASIVVATGTIPGPGGPRVRMHNCDSADTNYRFAEHGYEGGVTQETTIVRTSGASDGTTALAHKLVSSAAATFWRPLQGLEIVQWNESTGASMTATVEIVHDSVTALTDAEVWLDLQYLGTSGFPKGTIGSDRAATVLATPAAQTASVVAWTTTGLTNPNKQKLVVTFTPQEKGYVHARVKLAKASYTVYVDPLLVLA